MTHVSKYRMKERTAQEISSNFIRTLFSTQNGKKVLHALLTPTERTMLTKRLALIVMLEKNFSYYRISNSLKVSTSTIKRIHENLEMGMYDSIQSALKGSKKSTFLELLELVLAPYSISRQKHADIRRRIWSN